MGEILHSEQVCSSRRCVGTSRFCRGFTVASFPLHRIRIVVGIMEIIIIIPDICWVSSTLKTSYRYLIQSTNTSRRNYYNLHFTDEQMDSKVAKFLTHTGSDKREDLETPGLLTPNHNGQLDQFSCRIFFTAQFLCFLVNLEAQENAFLIYPFIQANDYYLVSKPEWVLRLALGVKYQFH